MNYLNFFMYLMCNFKYFCKNYRFCIYTVVMGNNKTKKKKKKMSTWTELLSTLGKIWELSCKGYFSKIFLNQLHVEMVIHFVSSMSYPNTSPYLRNPIVKN